MKITSIESFDDTGGKDLGLGEGTSYEGYKIKTTTKEFVIGISNGSSCCESWGHITSEDNLNKFIGAEILNYRCINSADYNEIELTRKNAGEYVDVYDCAFIDFNTDRGVLQFAVYTSHNGYYGHHMQIVEKPTQPGAGDDT